jgi:hypothetical protein
MIAVMESSRPIPLAAKPTLVIDAIGHFQSTVWPESRHTNDRFQSAAAIVRRLLEGADSSKQSITALRRWPTSNAVRTSAVRSAELELPTQTSHLSVRIRRRKADIHPEVSSQR